MSKQQRIVGRSLGGQSWLPLFLDYISHLKIDSKEIGVQPLAENLYSSQIKFLEEICEGLDKGIRSFTCLKARQLGASTISLAIDLFWLSLHEGVQGALVTDTEANKEKFRILLDRYLESLPRSLQVGVVNHNRNNLVLKNGSVLDYLVAGTRASNRGGLGRSRALNFLHATEVSSWGNYQDVASLMASLAQKHPDRLYIWESTAKGFNLWHDLWNAAKEDKFSQKAFFLGWWSKEDYAFPRDSREFKHYWNDELDDGEKDLVAQVQADYKFIVTPEQIAWHRWMRTVKITDEDVLNAEYPWTEEQAFVLTGRSFFPLRRVSEDLKFIEENKVPFQGYRYHMGENFLATEIEQVFKSGEADLRVWEEPHPNGVYVMGIDPAFGRSDDKDRHCIEIYRCYADKLVQVAEYATSVPDTYQVAWVMSHLAGSYKNIWMNLEVSGPGFACMDELRHLKQLVHNGYLNAAARQSGMMDVFNSVKWYLYHKPDQLGPGYVYGWKTNQDNKLLILNQMRDAYSTNMLIIRSVPLLWEMERVVQDGASIEAERGRNSFDDRVFATALANKSWIDWVRMGMIQNNMTYSDVTARDEAESKSPQSTMIGNIVAGFFKEKSSERIDEMVSKSWDGDDW